MKYANRRSLKGLFFLLFTIIFLISVVQGLTASSCRKEYLQPDKRVKYCSVSTFISKWSILSEPYKRSILFAHRAIAYSQVGSHVNAIVDFKMAWIDATKAASGGDGAGYETLSLRQRSIIELVVRQGKDSPTEKNFKRALVDLGFDPSLVSRLLANG